MPKDEPRQIFRRAETAQRLQDRRRLLCRDWVIIQVAAQFFPFFEITNSAVQLVVPLLLLSFSVAMALAWAFEMPPEGIRREDGSPNEIRKRKKGRLLTAAIVSLATGEEDKAFSALDRGPLRSVRALSTPRFCRWLSLLFNDPPFAALKYKVTHSALSDGK